MVEALWNIIIWLRSLSIRLKLLSNDEFISLISACTDREQVMYAVLLRFYL